MIILVHVMIALASIASSSYVLLRPSKRAFQVNYGLIGSTFASGIYLVWSTHSALLPACLAGLIYLTAVTFMTAIAYRRFNVRERN
jgi:hypothetical protein